MRRRNPGLLWLALLPFMLAACAPFPVAPGSGSRVHAMPSVEDQAVASAGVLPPLRGPTAVS